MPKLFQNLLFPIYSAVDLGNLQNTIWIANKLQCNIHVMHIINRRRKWRSSNLNFNEPANKKIFESAKSLCQLNSICSEELKENNENNMTTFCRKHLIDLVLRFEDNQTHRQSTWSKIVINRVAEKIGFPILSVSANATEKAFKKIVLPVDGTFQLRHLTLAAYISKLFHSKIFLISLNKAVLENGAEEAVSLYKVYHLLRDNTNIPVEVATADGNTITEATYQYAETINADLVFIIPAPRRTPILIEWFKAKLLYRQNNFSILAN